VLVRMRGVDTNSPGRRIPVTGASPSIAPVSGTAE
jgi:hypothetical protein